MNLRVEKLLVQVEHVRCLFYELPSHAWTKFQGNKYLLIVWKGYSNKMNFDSR